jgi:hypothetical protein
MSNVQLKAIYDLEQSNQKAKECDERRSTRYLFSLLGLLLHLGLEQGVNVLVRWAICALSLGCAPVSLKENREI